MPLDKDDFETGDSLEVAHVERGDIEAEMHCYCPDDQVLVGDQDSFGDP